MTRVASSSTMSSNWVDPASAATLPVPSGAAAATADSLLPAPDVGNVDFEIARMVLKNSFAQRKEAHDERNEADTAIVAAEKDQIAQMREAADSRETAAQWDAVGKAVEGAMGVVGGMTTAGVFGGTDKSRLEGLGGLASSSGKAFNACTSFFAVAPNKHQADLDDADAKAAEMGATEQKHKRDAADDDIKDARDQIRYALDFVQQYEETKTKAQSSAIKA